MKIRLQIAASVALALLSGAIVPVVADGAGVLMSPPSAVAQQAPLNLAGEGEGTLSIAGRPNQTITFVAVATRANQDDSVSRPPTTGTSQAFAQPGQGILGLQGRPNRPITFASASIQANGQAELSIRLNDGSLITFGGQQARQDAYEIVVNLTSSGMADAQGTANIRQGANNSIKGIVANGTMDGQMFFIQFTGQ
ncbi:hypothetical protein [Trichothermofontia sp.]